MSSAGSLSWSTPAPSVASKAAIKRPPETPRPALGSRLPIGGSRVGSLPGLSCGPSDTPNNIITLFDEDDDDEHDDDEDDVDTDAARGKRQRLDLPRASFSTVSITGTVVSSRDILTKVDELVGHWLASWSTKFPKRRQQTLQDLMDNVISPAQWNNCVTVTVNKQSSSKWTREGAGKYACYTCVNAKRPCFKVVNRKLQLLPLLAEVATSADESDIDHYIYGPKISKDQRSLWN